MKQISSLLKHTKTKKLLVIFPHPDDETVMSSGLIMQALAQKWQVKVVCVTNGVLGQIHIHGQGKNIVQIRRQELETAMNMLGVTDVEYWPHCDGSLSQIHDWKSQVIKLLDAYKPSLVVTYGSDGVSGHPDHLALGEFVYQQWNKHETFSLLWPAFTGQLKKRMVKSTVTKRAQSPEFILELSLMQRYRKWRALVSHESQNLSSHSPLPLWLVVLWFHYEYYARPQKDQTYNFDRVRFDLGI